MALDPTNATFQNTTNRPERENTPDTIKVNNVNNQGISEAGQTSEVGPAVVANISNTTLETSRAINAPEQTAAQNRTNDIVDAEEKGQLKQPADQPAAPGAPPQGRIDTSA